MTFVDFMIVGAAKCGTTTLSEILSNHPDVCFSRMKEPHFFSKSPDWKANLDEYKNLYSPKPSQICGEGSTTYTCYPEFNKDTWQALYDFNPKLKLIYVMRDPVDRIVSQYMHNYLRGLTSEPFEKAVLNNSVYINRTRYYIQIKPYFELFNKEQILLLTLEEFIADRQKTLKKTADFLEIDYLSFSHYNVHANKSVGEAKYDVRVDAALSNIAVQKIKSIFPATLRRKVYDSIHSVLVRKFQIKPSVSDELNEAIWNLLMLDVLEIERIMGRKLTEWNFPATKDKIMF